MKKVLVLLMVLLSICSAAFAESLEEVLKDCKLDRGRWKVVEWFKEEKFVRFYDSQAVTVTGPGQFDVVIYDYYYDDCGKDSCKIRKGRHYHSEKKVFNTYSSTETLRSFETRDIDGNVVASYEHPANLQIASPLKRNSIEGKTMLKIKETVKDNKEFVAKEPVSSNPPKPSTDASPKYQTGFAPLPQPIGSTDGEGYTYLGRFTGQNYSSYVETIMHMVPYMSPTERDGVFDVYYYHKHGLDGNYKDGYGCRVTHLSGDAFHYSYCCVLKFIPLDKNGNKIKHQGVYTQLISMGHASKGASVFDVDKVRAFDTLTHELVASRYAEYDNRTHDEVERTTGNVTISKRLNPIGKNGKTDYNKMMFMHVEVVNSPYGHAMKYSNCPHNFAGFG